MTYRVGRSYGIHVYDDNRPVATFHDADEAARFVDAMNETCAAPCLCPCHREGKR